MHDLFIYLLKSTLIISVSYIGYELFLRREAYFRFNRFYMLSAIILAIGLPFISYPVSRLISYTPVLPDVNISAKLAVFTLEEVVIRAAENQAFNPEGYHPGMILLLIYLIGVVFQSFRFLYRLIRISGFIRTHGKLKADRITFVLMPEGSPAHSFMKWIFIDTTLMNSDDFNRIAAHEKVHISQFHTFDLFLTEVLIIIQWFNPFVYMLRKRIKENHEYLADRKMVSTAESFNTYQLLLMQYSGIVPTDSLTHNFSYSLLKRRLHMMKKPKRPFRFGLGVLFITALLAGVVFACSGPDKKVPDKTFTVVENPPEFPGGMEGLMEYLSSNIHYPETAKEQGIEGRVYINFIVDKDGSVDSARVLKGIGGGCDKEALRVVNNMPKWKPGMQKGQAVRVSYNLPVRFTLDRKEADSVYTLVDTMPKFPGGKRALMNYLANNIKYPEQAKKDSIQGRVFIKFIVEKDGSVSHVKLLRGIGGGCDTEAMRVVSNMPKWEPGLKDGKPVRISYNIPIKFLLD